MKTDMNILHRYGNKPHLHSDENCRLLFFWLSSVPNILTKIEREKGEGERGRERERSRERERERGRERERKIIYIINA